MRTAPLKNLTGGLRVIAARPATSVLATPARYSGTQLRDNRHPHGDAQPSTNAHMERDTCVLAPSVLRDALSELPRQFAKAA